MKANLKGKVYIFLESPTRSAKSCAIVFGDSSQLHTGLQGNVVKYFSTLVSTTQHDSYGKTLHKTVGDCHNPVQCSALYKHT